MLPTVNLDLSTVAADVSTLPDARRIEFTQRLDKKKKVAHKLCKPHNV